MESADNSRKSVTCAAFKLKYVAIVTFLCACALYATVKLISTAARVSKDTTAACKNRASSIRSAIAFAAADHNYEFADVCTQHHIFQGYPMSWRVLLLPYSDQVEAFNAYRQNEPWNSSHNYDLIDKYPNKYLCPSLLTKEGNPYASYICSTNKLANAKSGEIANSTRSASSAPLVIEVCHSGVVWTNPEDNSSAGIDSQGQVRSCHDNLVTVLFLDGSVRQVRAETVRFLQENDE
jgi:prepilin-type processing-associated H-X9-DG protein